MNKKVIVVVIILVIGFWCLGIYKKNNRSNNVASYNTENVVVEEKEESAPKEITIYDIEEGYLTVPYNNQANKHTYNWEQYLNTSEGLYKYEDENYESKIGVDVSSHQKNINWKKVKEAGVDFAILRIGYRGYGESGKIVLDPYFEENYRKAKKEGIEIGVYFFSQAITMEEVKEEAEFVLNHIDEKEITYPVVFDLEKIKNDTARTDNLTVDEITNMALEFCKNIEEKGYTASIYGNAKTFTQRMKLEQFNNYNKWYADYQEKPLYPYEFDIWQYTEEGTINGVSGNVDIDIQFVKKQNI